MHYINDHQAKFQQPDQTIDVPRILWKTHDSLTGIIKCIYVDRVDNTFVFILLDFSFERVSKL